MKRKLIKFLGLIILLNHTSVGQNLPSLLLDKNINSTFSIIAYDSSAKEWGIAVATNNIYVGNSTIYIEPGIGAFSVIAETNPKYGLDGIKHLKSGKAIEESILTTKTKDNQSHYRQVSGIDANGNCFAFTGESLKYWKGMSNHQIGNFHVVMGNQLHTEVLNAMSSTFTSSEGTLAQRLVKSLTAGQNAGGQISGKQSAAVVVKGLNNEWYNQIDLRVDHSESPVEDLNILLNYHYGRIKLNQSIYAIRSGNQELGKSRLKKAEEMVDGWTGIYPRVITAYLLLDDKKNAVKWIQKGLTENVNWKVKLPAFYVLKDQPEISSLINTKQFTITDWEIALGMYSNLGRELELIELANQLISERKESSYLFYLLGRAYYYEKDHPKAIDCLTKSLNLDIENREARALFNKLN